MPSRKSFENEILVMKKERLRTLKNKTLCFLREQHSSCTGLVAIHVSFPPTAPIEVLNLEELRLVQRASCHKLLKPSPLWWACKKGCWGGLVRQDWAAGSSRLVAWTTWFIWSRQQQSPQMNPAPAVSQVGVGLLAVPTYHFRIRREKVRARKAELCRRCLIVVLLVRLKIISCRVSRLGEIF